MKKDVSKYIVTAVFIAVLAGFFAAGRFIQPPPILESERRPPAAFPTLSLKNVLDATFMGGFDKWAQDGFAMREQLRTLRAGVVFDVFRQSDKGGLYIGDTGAGKFQKIDETAWRQTLAKVNKLADVISGSENDCKIYFAVIPDKSVYAGRYLPGYDEETAKRIVSEGLSPACRTIGLAGALEAGDFYRTDLHWSQPKAGAVVEALAQAMGVSPPGIDSADIETAGSFKGAYAGQVALPMKADTLLYVSSELIESASAMYLDPKTQAMRPGKVYYPEALAEKGDPYDFFLGGPQPLIVLEEDREDRGRFCVLEEDAEPSPVFFEDAEPSPVFERGRVLYLFRDSFGSSLAPLLLGGYDRVVLIDLRYIDSRVLGQFVEFEPGSDILFLYSSQIMGSPTTLLVN